MKEIKPVGDAQAITRWQSQRQVCSHSAITAQTPEMDPGQATVRQPTVILFMIGSTHGHSRTLARTTCGLRSSCAQQTPLERKVPVDSSPLRSWLRLSQPPPITQICHKCWTRCIGRLMRSRSGLLEQGNRPFSMRAMDKLARWQKQHLLGHCIPAQPIIRLCKNSS